MPCREDVCVVFCCNPKCAIKFYEKEKNPWNSSLLFAMDVEMEEEIAQVIANNGIEYV